jgi:hypothetical protein
VYNFPLWLRKFTYNKLLEFHTKKNDNSEDVVETTRKNIQQAGYANKPAKKINTPDYVLKASKNQ